MALDLEGSNDGGASLGKAKTPALQPVLAGCAGAWPLLGDPAVPSSFYADRGPHNRPLVGSQGDWVPNPIPDLIPGRFSVCNDLTARAARVDCCPDSLNGFVYTVGADSTWIGRVYFRPSAATWQTWLDFSSAYGSGSLAPSCQFRLSADTTGEINCYHQYGPMSSLTDIAFQSTLTLRRAAWTPVAMRRQWLDAVHMQYIVDVPGAQQTSPVFVGSTGQDNMQRQLNFGQWGAWQSGGVRNGNDNWSGGMADFQILPTRCATDVEVATAFATMLGL